MTVVLIDYGSGNLRSAAKAFERSAREAGLDRRIVVSADPEAVARADRLVLPGVGAFADCMAGIGAVAGLRAALEEAVIGRGRPFLGICVGMQLMARRGLEHGVHDGLGWIEAEVRALAPADAALKIPHMGWNELRPARRHAVLDGIGPGAHAYFVHSFAMAGVPAAATLATVDYGGPVVAAVGRDNMVGTQFHPEKSQATGLRLIRNFLIWQP
ncbi:MAG: imidazole glycerol phosphate synthase subunit HisH [Alphaproteobacteria bacterium]|nr:imidazole glycerol phosphate synthase subunit HisH [Alphaproteobacteria bacterium]